MRLQILHRLVAPVVLALGGVASWFWGTGHHAVEVFVKTEVTETIKVPVPMAPSAPMGGSSPWGAMMPDGTTPGEPSQEEPAFVTQKVQVVRYVARSESEPTVVRQMTVGGVARVRDPDREELPLEPGQLVQTYTGDSPALCPT